MKRFGTTTRIAFAMAMWSAVVLLGLRLLGILDDGSQQLLTERRRLCETIAVSCSQFASLGDTQSVRVVLETLVARHPDVLSAACRPATGEPLLAAGDHLRHWPNDAADDLNANRIAVGVLSGRQPWGRVEIAFQSPIGAGLVGLLKTRSLRVIGLATLVNLLAFSVTLRRCFHHLDPAQAVPERVRGALNTLAEPVFILDAEHRIMLANAAVAQRFGRSADSFQGQTLESLPWEAGGPQESLTQLIGRLLQRSPDGSESEPVQLRINGVVRTFKSNASRIDDQDGIQRGTLLSLDDITVLAQRTDELRAAMTDLQCSRQAIQDQNEQLRYLATRDPMTGCLNRRSFFEHFEEVWKSSRRYQHPLSCLMVDVDHFKSINDQHGHAMGDEVLKRVAQVLRDSARETDLVCRYGGEEFCILMPHVDAAGAALGAERFRAAIADVEFPNLKVTASFGCAGAESGADTIEALLEQADQSLYAAKRSGRNRVGRFDELALAPACPLPAEAISG